VIGTQGRQWHLFQIKEPFSRNFKPSVISRAPFGVLLDNNWQSNCLSSPLNTDDTNVKQWNNFYKDSLEPAWELLEQRSLESHNWVSSENTAYNPFNLLRKMAHAEDRQMFITTVNVRSTSCLVNRPNADV
jgi:hypothetical protein